MLLDALRKVQSVGRSRRGSSRFSPRLEMLETRSLLAADVLYVGDGFDDSINEFDAETGSYTSEFQQNGVLFGPRGMLVTGNELLVANQNVDQPFNGEVLRYDRSTRNFLGALVPSSDPNAPFGPRGMVIRNGVLYVADLQADGPCDASNCVDGRVRTYNASNGTFLGDVNLGTLDLSAPGVVDADREFNPRGIVFGPDGLLYVSVFNPENPLDGHIVRFDVNTGFQDVFVDSDTCGCDLHRPEGLSFGPDGNLYITSFRADGTDSDRIVVVNGANGSPVGEIDLAAPVASGGLRAFAQALLFGPGGSLYVPITGGDASMAGEVRAYDVSDASYEVLIPNTQMGQAWFLTFGNTDSATLQYVVPVDGDFNDDGVYDARDIDALVAEIAAGTDAAGFDLSGDGVVDLVDRDAWLAEAGSVNLPSGNAYLLGDANLDGVVDGLDFISWNAHKFTDVAAWSAGDFNADGVVDGSDFADWNANKFTSANMISQPAGHVLLRVDIRAMGNRDPSSIRSKDPRSARDAVFAAFAELVGNGSLC